MRRNRSVLSVELPETVGRSIRDEIEVIARSRFGVQVGGDLHPPANRGGFFARSPDRAMAARAAFPLDPREPDPVSQRELYSPPPAFLPLLSPDAHVAPIPGSVAARQLIIRYFEGLVPPRGDEQMEEVCADMITASRAGVLNGINPDQLLRACHHAGRQTEQRGCTRCDSRAKCNCHAFPLLVRPLTFCPENHENNANLSAQPGYLTAANSCP